MRARREMFGAFAALVLTIVAIILRITEDDDADPLRRALPAFALIAAAVSMFATTWLALRKK